MREQVKGIANEIYKEVLRKKPTVTGYIQGGEYVVYKKGNTLKYAQSQSEKAQNADNIVCVIAYYNTPDITTGCKLEDIERKIMESLK